MLSPKDILQGKRLGHPLHPALVHIPLALWPASLVFDLLAEVRPSPVLFHTAFWCLVAGTLTAVPAVPTGLADWWGIHPGRPARKLGIYHMTLNLLVLALCSINILLRWRWLYRDCPAPLELAFNILSVALLAVSGYLGGRMVYAYGVGVARFSKDKWRAIAEQSGANVPPRKQDSVKS
jgi:uncharacterized membrane protein